MSSENGGAGTGQEGDAIAAQLPRSSAAAAASELGVALSGLGLASVEDLSDDNLESLDDLGAGHALKQQLESLGPSLISTLTRALTLVQKVINVPCDSTDTPTFVWNVLKEHAVEPRALSAFVYHVTTVLPVPNFLFVNYAWASEIATFNSLLADVRLSSCAIVDMELMLLLSQAVAKAPKGEELSEVSGENVKTAHSAAALYLALMRLPGSRSHIFNEFTFRSVVQTIRLIVAEPTDSGNKGKKRKGSAASSIDSRRTKYSEKREGSRKSARVSGSSGVSQQLADEDEYGEEMEPCQSDEDEDDCDASGSSNRRAAGDKENRDGQALGMNVLRQANLVAEQQSLQTAIRIG